MKKQQIITGRGDYGLITKTIEGMGANKILCICGSSFYRMPVKAAFDRLSKPAVFFSDYTPNPCLEQIWEAKQLFRREQCDTLVAIGGGTAIDIAKCVKAFYSARFISECAAKPTAPNHIKLLAIPTTAGSGSESTHFAVMYRGGEKISVRDISLLPDYVILEPALLDSLPRYQRISTMLDALCQSIESIWSLKASKESAKMAREAISAIMRHHSGYVENDEAANRAMQLAANLAGQAINITQTTAPHAMSYKLAALLHIAHGHAVALCLPKVWKYMVKRLDQGKTGNPGIDLNKRFLDIASCMGERSPEAAIMRLEDMLKIYQLSPKSAFSDDSMELLVKAVNVERLENNPVPLDHDALREIYREALTASE